MAGREGLIDTACKTRKVKNKVGKKFKNFVYNKVQLLVGNKILNLDQY